MDGKILKSFTSTEVVVLAAYLLGGDHKSVDTEDLAVKVNEIAPGRYNWRKFPKQINLELVRVYASDAKKETKGALLRGSGNDGWMVTEAGLAWAKTHVESIQTATLGRNRTTKEDKALNAERARLLSTDAYDKAKRNQEDEITLREAEIFFRIDPYVTGDKREERVLRIVNVFKYDPELSEIVDLLATRIRGQT